MKVTIGHQLLLLLLLLLLILPCLGGDDLLAHSGFDTAAAVMTPHIVEPGAISKLTESLSLHGISREPQVLLVPEFLSVSECEQLIALASAAGMHTAETGSTGHGVRMQDVRKADVVWLTNTTHPLMQQLAARAAIVLGVSDEQVAASGGIQLVHYREGKCVRACVHVCIYVCGVHFIYSILFHSVVCYCFYFIGGGMDGRTDGRTNGRTDGRTDGRGRGGVGQDGPGCDGAGQGGAGRNGVYLSHGRERRGKKSDADTRGIPKYRTMAQGMPKTKTIVRGIPKYSTMARGIPNTKTLVRGIPKCATMVRGIPKTKTMVRGIPKPQQWYEAFLNVQQWYEAYLKQNNGTRHT